MNAHARFEEDLAPDADGSKTAAAEHFSASTGTFSLRRAQYLNKSGQPPACPPSDSGVVLPFENTNQSRSGTALTPETLPTKQR